MVINSLFGLRFSSLTVNVQLCDCVLKHRNQRLTFCSLTYFFGFVHTGMMDVVAGHPGNRDRSNKARDMRETLEKQQSVAAFFDCNIVVPLCADTANSYHQNDSMRGQCKSAQDLQPTTLIAHLHVGHWPVTNPVCLLCSLKRISGSTMIGDLTCVCRVSRAIETRLLQPPHWNGSCQRHYTLHQKFKPHQLESTLALNLRGISSTVVAGIASTVSKE